jgi:hypothetical protein
MNPPSVVGFPQISARKQELQYKRGIGDATLEMGHASNDSPQVRVGSLCTYGWPSVGSRCPYGWPAVGSLSTGDEPFERDTTGYEPGAGCRV